MLHYSLITIVISIGFIASLIGAIKWFDHSLRVPKLQEQLRQEQAKVVPTQASIKKDVALYFMNILRQLDTDEEKSDCLLHAADERTEVGELLVFNPPETNEQAGQPPNNVVPLRPEQ